MDTAAPLRSVRLDPAAVHRVLDWLDANCREPADELRSDPRYTYRCSTVRARMLQPGATTYSTFQVTTRDICRSGVSFIHGGFVHATTQCTVALQDVEGNWVVRKGQVARCFHAQGLIHLVGVKFEDEMDVELFIALPKAK